MSDTAVVPRPVLRREVLKQLASHPLTTDSDPAMGQTQNCSAGCPSPSQGCHTLGCGG